MNSKCAALDEFVANESVLFRYSMMKYHEIHRELGLHMEEDIANIPSKDLFPTLSMLEANGLEFNPEHNIGPITLNHNFLTHNEARQLDGC